MSRKPPVPPGSMSKYDPKKPKMEKLKVANYLNDRAEYERMKNEIKRVMLMSPSDMYFFDSGKEEPRHGGGSSFNPRSRGAVEEYLHVIDGNFSWADMIGNAEAVEEIRLAITAATANPELYAFYNMKPPKGAMLSGPPGCGKTMLARIAGSIMMQEHSGKGGEVLILSGPEIQQPFIGRTEEKIRNIFAYAREYKAHFGHPLVVFIDEADALFPPRGQSYRYEASQVATMLAELDGVNESSAFVLLATNRPDHIDEALLRPGRIDRKIKVGRPSLRDIEEHFRRAHRTNPMRCEEDRMQELASYVVSPDRIVGKFTAGNIQTHEVQEVPITLAHIISGAICVQVFVEAKKIAFLRDLNRGPEWEGAVGSGLFFPDLLAAVDRIVADNYGMEHAYARAEIVDALNLKEKVKGMN